MAPVRRTVAPFSCIHETLSHRVGPPRVTIPCVLFAHAGHWLTTIAYFVPVVLFLAWLLITQIKDRRSGG